MNAHRYPPARANSGFTAIELLIAMGIMGILIGIGVVALRPPASRLAAQDFQALLQEARMEAIKRNRPVSVHVDVDDGTVLVRASTLTTNVSCEGSATQIGELEVSSYRGVAAQTTMANAQMLWLPNGRSQRCNGGLMASNTTFSDGRSAFVVAVSAAGQVSVMRH